MTELKPNYYILGTGEEIYPSGVPTREITVPGLAVGVAITPFYSNSDEQWGLISWITNISNISGFTVFEYAIRQWEPLSNNWIYPNDDILIKWVAYK